MDLKKSQLSEEADRIDEEWSWFGLWKSCQIFILKEFFCGGSWYNTKISMGCFWMSFLIFQKFEKLCSFFGPKDHVTA